MGRHHVAADSARAVDRARAAGFANVSIDVILGWPGESRARWQSGLDALLELEPDHVSLYVLEVEGRSLLAHRRLQGTLALPDDDLVAELYREAIDRLGARGLERYEISNFARPGRASRHNLKYWSEAPFLGFGMSAHSFRGRRRWWNEDRYATYCRAVEAGRGATAGERILGELELAQEALMTGLRRAEGVDLVDFQRRHRIDPMRRWKRPLAEVEESGLVEVVSGRLRLTERGLLLSNEVLQIFV
jgi:oxygen-independent coproporphyrinogen-3 oxidase